jgi:hypothetical protein
MKTKFGITKRKVRAMFVWKNCYSSTLTRIQVIQKRQVQLAYT